MARPLMGKELFDLLLVLPYHFTTASFKHHKPVINVSGGFLKRIIVAKGFCPVHNVLFVQ